jgi:hypothetical protein
MHITTVLAVAFSEFLCAVIEDFYSIEQLPRGTPPARFSALRTKEFLEKKSVSNETTTKKTML